MSDDLRARIAAAAANAHYSDLNNADRDDQYWMTVADAVIAALNLDTPVEYLSVDGERRNFMVAGHYVDAL